MLRHSEAAYRANTEASQKPVEAGLWCEPYKGVIYDMMDGRLARRVYGALTNFGSEAEFLRANADHFAEVPSLGQKTTEMLVFLQESWR